MSLRLIVKSATDLPKMDRFTGKVDPYCQLIFREEKQSTTTISNNRNPEWNETLRWTLDDALDATEAIEVLILDHENVGKDRLVCKGSIPLASVKEKGTTSLDIAVVDPKEEPLNAKLHVDISYKAPIYEVLKEEVIALKARIKELEELLKNFKTTLTETQTELKETKEQIEPLKTENANAKAKIEQLQAEVLAVSAVEGLKVQTESLTKEVTALKQRLAEVEEQQRSEPQLQGESQPASSESGGHEQQPLVNGTEETPESEKKSCCCCCTLL